MLEKPDLSDDRIIEGARDTYAVVIVELEFLPIGHDSGAWVYRAESDAGTTYFLKLRKLPIDEISLKVPRFLKDGGMTQVVAPIAPVLGERLFGTVGDYALILYPFIVGQSAMKVGLTDSQWVEYGTIFRDLHATRLSESLRRQIPCETFVSSWGRGVRQLQARTDASDDLDPRAREIVAIWTSQRNQISRIVDRVDELGRTLQARSFDFVLCHTDLHLNNVLIDSHGRLLAVDWDAPLLAPKERDLHFVTGSRVGVAIGRREEDLIFQGYGPTVLDWPALIYFRYEWVCGDLLDYGEVALGTRGSGDAARDDAIRQSRSIFEPGCALATADALARRG